MAAHGEDEDRGGTYGLDDLLGRHGGAVDFGLVHPDGHALLAQVLNQLDDLLLVLPRVTDKNVRAHVNRALEQFGQWLSTDKPAIPKAIRAG